MNFCYIWFSEERRKKIADLLKAIEERLLSLETEKEELKQYQKWDRAKRGLECAICTSECDDAKKRIDEVWSSSILYFLKSSFRLLQKWMVQHKKSNNWKVID